MHRFRIATHDTGGYQSKAPNCGAFVASEGFEPTKSMTADLQSDPFGRLGNLPVQRTCVEANALRTKLIGKCPLDKPWTFRPLNLRAEKRAKLVIFDMGDNYPPHRG